MRDRWLDLLRAGSLAMVVVWHWVFTIIVWQPDGPHATNPIGSTRGLWAATWLLQVMPVFFCVGGAVHARALAGNTRWRPFVVKRLRALLVVPAILIALAVLAHRATAIVGEPPPWLARSLILLLSPLWFLGPYTILILIAPLAWRAHQRWGEVVPIVLGGLAMVVDVARFNWEVPYVEWANWVIVWAMVHQVGFHLGRIVAAPRRFAAVLAWLGLFGLVGLTNMNLYPRSAVGVPGEAFSNLGPPTLVIVALTCFQIGVVTLARDATLERTESGLAARVADWVTVNAQALYLGHAFAFAVVFVTWRATLGDPIVDTDWRWWALRPVWFALPALVFAAAFFVVRRVKPTNPASTSGQGGPHARGQ